MQLHMCGIPVSRKQRQQRSPRTSYLPPDEEGRLVTARHLRLGPHTYINESDRQTALAGLKAIKTGGGTSSSLETGLITLKRAAHIAGFRPGKDGQAGIRIVKRILSHARDYLGVDIPLTYAARKSGAATRKGTLIPARLWDDPREGLWPKVKALANDPANGMNEATPDGCYTERSGRRKFGLPIDFRICPPFRQFSKRCKYLAGGQGMKPTAYRFMWCAEDGPRVRKLRWSPIFTGPVIQAFADGWSKATGKPLKRGSATPPASTKRRKRRRPKPGEARNVQLLTVEWPKVKHKTKYKGIQGLSLFSSEKTGDPETLPKLQATLRKRRERSRRAGS
jgi:hypothetical protein